MARRGHRESESQGTLYEVAPGVSARAGVATERQLAEEKDAARPRGADCQRELRLGGSQRQNSPGHRAR